MATFIQPSFAKGEIGPALYGRVDTAAYQVALRTALNLTVHTHGGVSNRSGLQFICPVKTHTTEPVLIDFQFKATDTYVIEMGNLYMRFIRNDAQVLESTKTITAITKANPAVVTSGTHGYSNGDHVYIASVGGMIEVNGRWFQVANKATNTFELTDVYDGGSTGINSSSFTTYTSGGTAAKVYEVATPYATANLPELKWTQSADILTVTHPTYGVREVSRTDHNAWTITAPLFVPSIADPTVVAQAVNGADNNVNWKYKITAIKAETFEESLAGIAADLPNTASAITAANPPVVTSTAHDLLTGDEVEITNLTEMTELDDRRFIITKIDANSFSLDGFASDGEDASAYDAETTGGTERIFPTFDVSGTQAAPTGTTIPDNTITWTAVTNAVKYTIYRAEQGKGDYGFLSETNELTFSDDETAKVATDLSITPPTARNPFRLAGQFPGAVGYYQQRRVFGGSTNKPDTQYYSQTGNQSNFSTSRPIQADDAITATLNSRQVNEIRHFVPQGDLIVLTDGAEWRVNSGDNSGFSSDTLKQEPQTYWGANHLKPFVAGQLVLYCQENNIAIRSLGYQLSIDGYTGTDLNLLAPHIFQEHTIVSWGFARSPDPIIHIVRSDGDVATMTFNEEQEVLAWTTWHTRNGLFKWCTAMRPSSTDVHDAAYFVVERIINSNTVLLIEKVHSRRFQDVQDSFFIDSGLSLNTAFAISASTVADPVVLTTATHGLSDGDEIDVEGMIFTPQYDSDENETQPDQLNGRRYFIADKTSTTMNLFSNENGISIIAITQANPGVVTTGAAHGLVDGEIIAMHGIAGMTEANDNIYKIKNKTSTTFELNTAADADVNTSGFTAYTNSGSVYHGIDGSSFKAYVRGGNIREAVTIIRGLDHLEGESVAVLADGNVITGHTVASGKITLADKASRVHVGIKMVADMETLNVEAPDGTVQGKPKSLPKVTIRFEKSRGLLIGPDKDHLVEMKQRDTSVVMGAPTPLLTGDIDVTLKSSWDSNGRLLLRQPYPLPMTILAVVPDIEVGDNE
jgi:hypothetical protein